MEEKYNFTEDDVECVGEALKWRIENANGDFGETLHLLPNGSIKLPTKSEGEMVSLFAHIGSNSVDELQHLAQLITTKYPELKFTFKVDNVRSWIKYSVTQSL